VSSYRRVIVGTTAIATVIALLALVLALPQQTVLFSVVLGLEAIGDVASTIYLAYLSYTDKARPRSWLMLFLVVGSTFITAAFVVIAALVIARSAGYTLPPNVGTALTGTVLILNGAVPIMKGLLFWLVQHDLTIEAGVVADQTSIIEALLDDNVRAALAKNDTVGAATRIVTILAKAA
jgi:hypothetical protein